MTTAKALGIVGLGVGIGLGVGLGWVLSGIQTHELRRALTQAHKDSLTGLPDRAVADDVLKNIEKNSLSVSLGLVDINGLHVINNTMGHAAGDQLLIAVARHLFDLLPAGPGGFVARISGDEFLIVTPVTPEALAKAYRNNFNGLVNATSIGVASTPHDGDARHAMACADLAMSWSKSTHEPVTIYDEKLGTPEEKASTLPDAVRRKGGRA